MSGQKYEKVFILMVASSMLTYIWLTFLEFRCYGGCPRSSLLSQPRLVNLYDSTNRGRMFEERNRRVESVCHKYGLARTEVTEDGFKGKYNLTVLKRFYIWNGEHNMGYCIQSKTGTTTWILNWMKISHLPEEIELEKGGEHGIVKFLYAFPLNLKDPEVSLVLERAFSFYFVRHPFTRLVSGFQDKILNTEYNHWREFRTTIKQNETRNQIFQRFVDALLEDKMNIQWDIHNLPMHLKCDVCNIPYKIIGKQENFFKENQYIIENLGLNGIMDPGLKVHESGSSMELALQYFSALTRETVWKIYRHYKLDFEMYDYDPTPFLRIAQKDTYEEKKIN